MLGTVGRLGRRRAGEMGQPYGNGYGYGGYGGYGYGGGYRQAPPPQRRRGHGCLAVLAVVGAIVAILVVACVIARPLLADLGVFDPIAALLPDDGAGEGALAQEEHESLDRRLQGCYVYSQLSAGDKEKYRIMFDAFESWEAREYPYTGSDDLARVRNYVVADHPELFYISGVNARTTTTNAPWGQSSTTMIEGIYRYDAAQAETLQLQLEGSASECLAGIPADADDYGKVKYLYEYLAENVEYDWAAIESASADSTSGAGQTAVDALVGRSAVCAGYSNAFGFLAQKLGLQSAYVTGTARGDSHAWNVVLLDGDFYYVDVTWGDPQFVAEGGGPLELGRVNYDYLCVTTSDIMRDHVLDAGEIVPDCVAVADNYYVREGLLLESADVTRVGELVSAAIAEGQPSVQMRCATPAVYEQLKYLLFDQGEIYAYLPTKTCWYTTSDDYHSITVIL